MPTFLELFRSLKNAPLPAMLALSALLIFALLGKMSTQEEAKERAIRESTAIMKQCAEDRLKEQRRHEIEKDSLYRENLAIVNSALEKMGKMKEQIKRLSRK